MRQHGFSGLLGPVGRGEIPGPLTLKAFVMLACVVIVVAASVASALIHLRTFEHAATGEGVAPEVAVPGDDGLLEVPGSSCLASKRP